jgi:PAS domain S-box-containing protein
MEKDELEQRIKELEIELSLLKSGKVESPLLENESSFYNAGADPSEQKKVENVLKESEEKFKLIFEKSIAPIIVADDKGNYLEVNKAAAEIFEYSINELMGMNVGDLITTSNPNAVAQYEEYIKKGEEIGEFGFISKKGTFKILQYQAVRIKPDCNLSILMDVTEQKKASQYARSLIEASLDPLVTISADGKITDVNEASIKVTGVEREKLIDTDFSNYFTEPQKAQEGYQQVFQKGFVADYPLTIKHKNGNLTDVLYNASVYKDDKGNVLGVFAAARDVTEQKQASQYARSLIEASLDPLVTISADGKITDVNEASIKVTGVEREKLIDTDFSNYFTEPQKAQEGYQQVFEKGFVADYPLTIKHKNGNLTDVLYNASVYKDDKGNVLGVFAAARDVTERKMFEKEMIDAKVSAENAAKSKQQFLSNMSHEIRTPLNSILGFTNVLLKTELGSQQKEFVEAINTSGKSLNLLINDILDLAKVDAGKMTFEKHPIEIRKSISAILHSFDLKIKEKNLELAVEHDSKVPSILWCDSLRLNQIFFNLLSNAIKFTHKGKIKLTIKLLHEDKENVTIEFVVSDSGIGIADNKLNSIFNLFEQAEINTSTSYGGTGLGLSIVKQLVEGQGGSVSVKSKLGEGSAFSFILPFGIANLKLEEEIIHTTGHF